MFTYVCRGNKKAAAFCVVLLFLIALAFGFLASYSYGILSKVFGLMCFLFVFFAVQVIPPFVLSFYTYSLENNDIIIRKMMFGEVRTVCRISYLSVTDISGTRPETKSKIYNYSGTPFPKKATYISFDGGCILLEKNSTFENELKKRIMPDFGL